MVSSKTFVCLSVRPSIHPSVLIPIVDDNVRKLYPITTQFPVDSL